MIKPYLSLTAHAVIMFLLLPLSSYADELAQLQRQQQQLGQQISAVSSEISQLTTSLKDDAAALVKAESKLEEKAQKMAALFEQAKSDSSQTTQRRATLAAINYNREIDRVERLRSQIADAEARIKELNQQQDKKQYSHQQLVAQIKALKASAKASTKVKLHKPNIKAPSTTNPPIAAEQAPSTTPSIALSTAPSTAVTKEAEKTPNIGTWLTLNMDNVENRQFTINAIERAKKNNQRPPLPKVKINAAKSFGSEDMEYLGSNLYQLTDQVSAGYQSFKVFNKKFWLTIPNEDNGARYIFIYDVNSFSQPKLYAFRENLLTP